MKEKEFFMQRCLALAKKGIYTVAPNPMVGCVITVEDEKCQFGERIIGEGYHRAYGEGHAEVNAIESVKDKELLKEATAYVSLEPCSHFGKTPPCAQLLIKKQLKKVVVGAKDPNPKVAGKGIALLRKSGVRVEEGVLAAESQEMNKRFFTYHKEKRPYIILKWAQSADGFIARKDGSSKWISNPRSRQIVHQWRAQEQSIMVGNNTAIIDNPKLNVRDWSGRNPLRVVFNKRQNIPETHQLLSDELPTLLISQSELSSSTSKETLKISFKNPMKETLQELYKRGINSLFVEGGSTTLNAFIEDGIWDECRIFTGKDVYFNTGIPAPVTPSATRTISHISKDEQIIIRNSPNKI